MIKKYFDDFVFAARVMPAATAGLPLLVLSAYRGFIENSWSEGSVTFAIAIILIAFLSYIAREWGKNYEGKMYKELGAMTTTIILRFADNKISSISKLRYHKWFNDNLTEGQLPMSLSEEQEDSMSDEKYIAAMTFLRTHVNSNRDKFPRVYQELKKYNFWRNLYGCKFLSIVTYLVLILREFIIIDSFNLKEMIVEPFPKYIVFGGLFIWMLLFCSIVTKKTVKRNAFDYAKTLIETIENLA